MHIVYATGRSPQLQFALARQGQSLSADAEVFAICHGRRSIRNLDDALLDVMTDREFFKLAKMVRAAIALEIRHTLATQISRALLPEQAVTAACRETYT